MSKIIKSSVYLRNLHLKKIPDIFQGVKVQGNFYCYHNQLTSLEGAPEYVGGHFHCGVNQLTSLEGAPKYVGRNFYCYNNAVKFTEEQVRAVFEVKGYVYV